MAGYVFFLWGEGWKLQVLLKIERSPYILYNMKSIKGYCFQITQYIYFSMEDFNCI